MSDVRRLAKDLEDPDVYVWSSQGRYGVRVRAWRKKRDGKDEQVEFSFRDLRGADLECIATSIAKVFHEDVATLDARTDRLARGFARG